MSNWIVLKHLKRINYEETEKLREVPWYMRLFFWWYYLLPTIVWDEGVLLINEKGVTKEVWVRRK